MRFLLLALFASVAFVAAGPTGHYGHGSYPVLSTRVDCPPAGYVALAPNSNLDHLPSGGKYAICQTQEQADAAVDSTWTVTSGVFRLRNSELIVDSGLQIVFQYPARPDWTDVAVKYFQGGDPWLGISIRGAPSDEELALPYQNHYPIPFGNCGDFDTVVIDNVRIDSHSLTFDHCTEPTTVKKITTFSGDVGLVFVDSKEIVVKEAFLAGTTFLFLPPLDLGPIDLDLTLGGLAKRSSKRYFGGGYRGVKTARSELGFVDLVIYGATPSDFHALEILDGSSITVCNLFAHIASGIEVGAPDSASPSSVAIAGVTNLNFGNGDVNFEGPGGVVFTLRDCPAVMRTSYDMREWLDFWTTGGDDWR